MNDESAALAVAVALPQDTQSRIRTRWDVANPHLAGAPVADIIDMLASADSDLDLIEDIPAEDWPRSPAAIYAARALIWGRDWGELRQLDTAALAKLCAEAGAVT